VPALRPAGDQRIADPGPRQPAHDLQGLVPRSGRPGRRRRPPPLRKPKLRTRVFREKDGESQDRGRALADARKRILELAEKATAIETGLRQRDWQMEQQRERARQAMGLLKDITAPVQTEAGAVASPPGRMGAVSSRETEAGALASLRAGMGRQP
jgi:hypothetical protein